MGINFNQYRSIAATQLLIEAEKSGDHYFLSPLSIIPGGYNLMVIAPDKLTKKSLELLSSGHYPKAREPFKPFARMLDMKHGEGVQAWVFEQSHAANKSRKLLANHMGNRVVNKQEREQLINAPYFTSYLMENGDKSIAFEILRLRVRRKIDQALNQLHDNPEPCLYQWVHQMVMELICEHVLGITQVPKTIN